MNKRLIAPILAAALILPTAAVAADLIAIDSKVYTQEEHPDGVSCDGSNSGTWSWDGKDKLTLTDYDGGPVAARGDIEIELVGENTVTSHNQDAILVWGDDAKLTITGDGSLTADMTVDQLDVTHPLEGDTSQQGPYGVGSNNVGTINNINGDTEIRDTTVVANSRFNETQDGNVCSAISNYHGDLTIVNSQVEAAWYVDHEMNYGGNSCLSTSGRSTISNSTFEIKVVPLREVPETYSTIGWHLDHSSPDESPLLTIDASTVHITGSMRPLQTNRYFGKERIISGEPIPPAMAFTGGSELILPEDASVINSPHKYSGEYTGMVYTTIGYGEEPDENGFYDIESIRCASEVLIKVPEPEPEPTPEPVPTPDLEPAPAPAPAQPTPAAATVLPKTADAALLVEGSVAASGALLALAGILRRRR